MNIISFPRAKSKGSPQLHVSYPFRRAQRAVYPHPESTEGQTYLLRNNLLHKSCDYTKTKLKKLPKLTIFDTNYGKLPINLCYMLASTATFPLHTK